MIYCLVVEIDYFELSYFDLFVLMWNYFDCQLSFGFSYFSLSVQYFNFLIDYFIEINYFMFDLKTKKCLN